MEERNYRKTRIGEVVSDKMDKTIVVAIKENEKHPLYGKVMNRKKIWRKLFNRKYKKKNNRRTSSSSSVYRKCL